MKILFKREAEAPRFHFYVRSAAAMLPQTVAKRYLSLSGGMELQLHDCPTDCPTAGADERR